MELRHLKYFLTLAEELSFSRAAEKLFISQPPLSRQIKELEDEIGASLFNRNNKRVTLTEAGLYFEKEIRQLFQSLERITLKTEKISKHISGEFRIGYIGSTFSGNITKLLKHLSSHYPYVTFRLYEVATSKQVIALEQGKLDLGIVRGPLASPAVISKVWFKDTFSVVFNTKRIKLKTEKEFEKLKEEAFVFYNQQYAPHYYDTLLQLCATFGFTPRVTHESNNVTSILQLVKEGLGTSILPTSVIRNNTHKEIGFLELKSTNLFSEVLFATPKGERSIIGQEAIKFLKELV